MTQLILVISLWSLWSSFNSKGCCNSFTWSCSWFEEGTYLLKTLKVPIFFQLTLLHLTSHSPALLDLFYSHKPSIYSTVALPPMGNSDRVASFSSHFLSNSKGDALFHRTAYDYSWEDWDVLYDHVRDASWHCCCCWIFMSEFRLELMYISLIVNISPCLIDLNGF